MRVALKKRFNVYKFERGTSTKVIDHSLASSSDSLRLNPVGPAARKRGPTSATKLTSLGAGMSAGAFSVAHVNLLSEMVALKYTVALTESPTNSSDRAIDRCSVRSPLPPPYTLPPPCNSSTVMLPETLVAALSKKCSSVVARVGGTAKTMFFVTRVPTLPSNDVVCETNPSRRQRTRPYPRAADGHASPT